MDTPECIYLQVCDGCEFTEEEREAYRKEEGRDLCADCWKQHPIEEREPTWSSERIYKTDVCYFSEQAVRDLLRDEYKQANYLIRTASRFKNTVVEDLIGVEQSIESAIKKLRGGQE